jgi:LysR family hydrogen peroxide-inducible transcriptional activator
MTLTELKYVVAVAKERHFGRAAERCFVSQPSLSAAIKKLEDELGVQIFERGHGEILLTPLGERIVAQAERALEETARITAIARAGSDPLAGPLHLGVIHTVAPYLLPGLVAELRRLAPKMPLDIEENMTATLDQMLRSGQIDAAIVALPYEAPGVELIPLYEEEFKVIVPKDHAWARRKAIDVDELDGENLLLLSIGHCFRDQVLEVCREFSRPPNTGKQGNSLETIRSMVASGIGISVMPATALVGPHASQLVRAIDFRPPRPSRRLVLAMREQYPRLAALQTVARAIRQLKLPVKFPDAGRKEEG